MSSQGIPSPGSAGTDSARAWLIVLAAFLGAFVTFGVTYCFGVFLKPMAAEFKASHAAMSALFSTITVLSFFLAPFTGELADRFGPRPVVATGTVLMAAGLMLTAHVHEFPLLFVTYGFGVGAAGACIYIPAVSAVGEWFKVHRDIALGVAISGIGIGTLVAAPLAGTLTERYGWRTTFEVYGWGSAVLLGLCAALLSRPPIPKEKGNANLWAKVFSSPFGFLYGSLLFCGIAVFVTFVYLPAFAGEVGISRVAAAALVGYIGAASVVGRLGLDAFAPRFGLINMYRVAFVLLLVSFALWIPAHSYGMLVGYALLMGMGYGGIAAMAPAVAALLFGVEGLGELLGIFFTCFGVACLIGPPVAGILVDHTHDYRWPVLVAAGSAAAAVILVLPVRAAERAAGRATAAGD